MLLLKSVAADTTVVMDTVAVDTAAVVMDSTAVEAPAASDFKLQKKNKTIRANEMAFLLPKTNFTGFNP
jgi:hypothetical protein